MRSSRLLPRGWRQAKPDIASLGRPPFAQAEERGPTADWRRYCLGNRGCATQSAGSTCGARLLMEFAHEQAGDVSIVKLTGRLDSSTAQSAEDSFVRMLG